MGRGGREITCSSEHSAPQATPKMRLRTKMMTSPPIMARGIFLLGFLASSTRGQMNSAPMSNQTANPTKVKISPIPTDGASYVICGFPMANHANDPDDSYGNDLHDVKKISAFAKTSTPSRLSAMKRISMRTPSRVGETERERRSD